MNIFIARLPYSKYSSHLQVIDDIIGCTREVYKEVKSIRDLKVFFLVGGFAECTILRESLKEDFPGISVLKPREPGLAVLKGAVMFADNTAVITERRLSRSYGTEFSK